MLLNLIPNTVWFQAFFQMIFELLPKFWRPSWKWRHRKKRAPTIIFILIKILTLDPYEPKTVETRHSDLFSGCRCVQPNRGIFATTKKERKFQRAITLSKIVRFCSNLFSSMCAPSPTSFLLWVVSIYALKNVSHENVLI